MPGFQLNQLFENKDLREGLHNVLVKSSPKSNIPGEPDLMCGNDPFPHCVVRNFLQDQKSVNDLEKTVLRLDYLEKNNDLYKFKQTKALERRKESQLKDFKGGLITVSKWLSKLFGVELSDKIDMFSAQYNYTDTLLCHDDELEGRRIAYIYYLVPEDWSQEDGGTLDLFSMDSDTGLPTTVKKSLTPVRNSFAFFEVTPKSFHQVAEVLSETKCRLSISGWFHGPTVSRTPHATEAAPERITPADIDEETLYSLINQEYVSPVTQSEIQEKFEEDSEIQLSDFLPPDQYEEMCTAIRSDEIKWVRKGPAIKRNVDIADESTLPDSIKNCLKLLSSDAVFLILSNMTGLKLHPLAAESDSESETEAHTPEPQAKKSKSSLDKPNGERSTNRAAAEAEPVGACGTVSYQVRRWSQGCYTLLHDTDMEQGKEYALDAVIHFNCDDWVEDFGGYTSYIAKGDDEELLTLEPRRNCLSLVYRDSDSLRFVKHINHKMTRTSHSYIYDISLVYHEP